MVWPPLNPRPSSKPPKSSANNLADAGEALSKASWINVWWSLPPINKIKIRIVILKNQIILWSQFYHNHNGGKTELEHLHNVMVQSVRDVATKWLKEQPTFWY
jgi:hypothetical protein